MPRPTPVGEVQAARVGAAVGLALAHRLDQLRRDRGVSVDLAGNPAHGGDDTAPRPWRGCHERGGTQRHGRPGDRRRRLHRLAPGPAPAARRARVRVLDNFATGRRANLAEVLGRGRADRGRPAELRARAQRRPRLRGRLPPRRAALGAALDPGPADQQRDQRHRHAQRAAGRPRRGPAPRRPRLLLLALRRQPRAAQARADADAADRPLRGLEAGGGGLLPRLPRGLRPGDGGAALLQRLRPRPGPAVAVRGGDPELHRRRARGPLAVDPRRRRAIARLHLRRQRGRSQPAGGERPGRRRRGVQHRLRRADDAERDRRPDRRPLRPRGRGAARRVAAGRRPPLARRHRQGAARSSATSRRSTSRRACAAPSPPTRRTRGGRRSSVSASSRRP